MALGLFKKDNKQKGKSITIPESMYDAPFEEIVAYMDPFYLEDSVTCYFSELFPHLKASDYKYFRLYESWNELFVNRLYDILNHFKTIDDFKTLVSIFPEYSYEIYEYLFKTYMNSYWGIRNHAPSEAFLNNFEEISLADDILIPMADFETYQYMITNSNSSRFNSVRERAFDIIDASGNFETMWDLIQVLEQYFDIPRENFTEYIESETSGFVDGLCCDTITDEDIDLEGSLYNFDINDYKNIKDLFMDGSAYDSFMYYLPLMLSYSGLELYNLMVKVLGPIPEVTLFHDWCAEFITQAEKHAVDDFFDDVEENSYDDDDERLTFWL